MVSKRCNVCEFVKSSDEFWVSKNGRTKDGLMNTCKECSKARRRAWAAKNRDREQEYNRQNYESHKEEFSQRAYQWRQDNPDRYKEIKRMSQSTRRAQIKDAFIEDVDPAIVYKMHGGMCGVCRDFVEYDNFHVDHIVPLAKGGQHGYINVQPAHSFCNLSKGAN